MLYNLLYSHSSSIGYVFEANYLYQPVRFCLCEDQHFISIPISSICCKKRIQKKFSICMNAMKSFLVIPMWYSWKWPFESKGSILNFCGKFFTCFTPEYDNNNEPKSAVRGGERYFFSRYDEPWSFTFKCLDGVYNVAMAISNNYVTEQQRVWLFSWYFWLVSMIRTEI